MNDSIRKFPTLYKKDNKNQIREWNVWIDISNTYGTIFVEHGLSNGKKQIKTTTIKSGKNIGKANETSIFQQCESEATSKWNKQKDKGYDETVNTVYFRPMLAHRMDKYPHKVKYPCYIQPKLDGLRCNILYDNGWRAVSRNGKPYKVLDHIISSFSLPNNIILDGELYSDDITFQEIVSACKRDEPNDLTQYIKIYLYDLFDKNKNLSFRDRYQELEKYVSNKSKLVPTYKCDSYADILSYHSKFIEDGYEGSIIRNTQGIYKVDGRSYDLLKLKDFEDAEFQILSVIPDKNDEAVFTCVMNDGKTFDVKPKGTHEERMEYLDTKYIGKMLTVQYFGLTDEGVPRFPVGLRIFSPN